MTFFLLGAIAGCGVTVVAAFITRRLSASPGDEPEMPPVPLLDDSGALPEPEKARNEENDIEYPAEDEKDPGPVHTVHRELLADWFWSMPYVRKLLGLVTEKTEAAAMGLIEKYQEVHTLASSAGEEARSARSTLNQAGDGQGVDALINATRERIESERERSAELARLGERTREQTRESDELIKRVNSIVEEIGDIADRSKVISINLGIEAAKIGKLGAPFKVIADQLRMLNTSTGEASRRAGALMEDFGAFQTRLVEDWQRTILENVSEAGESARVTEETIESLVSAIEELRAVFDRLIERTIASEGSMDEILAHLQFQDITRQQVENVDTILVDLVEQTKERMVGEIEVEQADAELIARLEEKLKHRFKVYDEESVLGGGS
ncbi:MAG: methyl-accepting chemotaxis protein [Alkalispirochaeta sp.]